MSELHEECGVAAIYHLPSDRPSPLCGGVPQDEVSRMLPRMLLDIQNRGQLAAGMTSYNERRQQLIDTHKQVGTVSEVFRMSHGGKRESLMQEYAGRDMKRLLALDKSVYDDGALPGSTKELLALTASAVLRCDDCVTYHLLQCRKHGIDTAELMEALTVALLIGGSVTTPHLRRAIETWDELARQS